MGFFKERKRAKELENSYNEISAFSKKIAKISDLSSVDVQSIFNECETILKKLESAKQIVSEDLNKSRELLMNSWFATRDAFADEYNIHQKRLQVLVKYETELNAFKAKLIENGAKIPDNKEDENQAQPGE